MTPSILVTGTSKYVEFDPGHVLINGQVLEIAEKWRIADDELTGSPAPNANYGDYYVFLRPNKKIMEAYYQQDWEYVLRSATAGGAAPAELPDELCIARIEKRDVSGVTQLAAVAFNTGKSLVDTKDISDKAVTADKIADGVLSGGGALGSIKDPCRVATTGNITIATALNAGDVIDTVTLANGDRVLVKDQTTASENGIYVVASSPARATDADVSSEIFPGMLVAVSEGSANGDKVFQLTTNGPITLNTTPLAFQVAPSSALLSASGMGVVVHGATAGTARPSGWKQVMWIGSVSPTNLGADDVWYDTSAVSDGLSVPTVTSLPGGPTDGMEVDFVADATDGVLWRMKYRASTTRWHFVGGPPIFLSAQEGSGSAGFNANNVWTSIGPGETNGALTTPFAGDFLSEMSVNFFGDAAEQPFMIPHVSGYTGGTALLDTIAQNMYVNSVYRATSVRDRRFVALASGASIECYCKAGNYTVNYANIVHKLTPFQSATGF